MTRSPSEADAHPHPAIPAASVRRRTDEKLDGALKATFPASDPFALTVDEDPNSRATYASPPCFMHELDPSYLGLQQQRAPCPADPAASGERVGAKRRGGAAPGATRAKEMIAT
jgi:hypothetical protein